MKNIFFYSIVFFTSLCSAQVGIGTNTPDPSAGLELYGTTKGLLIFRMTDTQRNAIANPANGLMIYNTTQNCLELNTGTPASPDWNCVGASTSGSTAAVVSSNCEANGFEGQYLNGVAMTGSNKFSVTITNNSFSTASISFATSDLSLSGISGVTVSSVSPTSTSLTTGASQVVEYSLSGTPASIGALNASWSKISLSCSGSVNVSNGDATLSIPTAIVVSIYDGTPLVDIQGVADNASNQLTVNIPYTGGIGSYDAYTSAWVASNADTGQGGDANSFRLSYPAGTFSSTGTIVATIEVDGDGSFDAEKQLFGAQETIATMDVQVNGNSKGSLDLDVIGGIQDRAFGDGVHNFIYLPVTAADGNVWLNNNLGANYANMNHAQFNPTQQATAHNDFHAYGSLYQWGRYSDGHELINYTNASTGTGVNGTTSTNANSDTPGHDEFITEVNAPWDWRVPQNNSLWQGEAGINNPCPQGYRLPTVAEYDALVAAEGITNYTTAASSTLAFSSAGARNYSSDLVYSEGSRGHYWSSAVNVSHARDRDFISNNTAAGSYVRTLGFSVRCLKE